MYMSTVYSIFQHLCLAACSTGLNRIPYPVSDRMNLISRIKESFRALFWLTFILQVTHDHCHGCCKGKES